MIRVACLVYGILGLAGLSLTVWRGGNGHFLFQPLSYSGQDWVLHTIACLALITLTHIASQIALKYSLVVQRSARDLKLWLIDCGKKEILILALASGLAEEIFFRGWLLNEIGLFYSSILFGFMHLPPNRNWRLWPIFAFIMGFLLGGLCLWTQTIYYAMAAHAAINYLNIRGLDRHKEIPSGEFH